MNLKSPLCYTLRQHPFRIAGWWSLFRLTFRYLLTFFLVTYVFIVMLGIAYRGRSIRGSNESTTPVSDLARIAFHNGGDQGMGVKEATSPPPSRLRNPAVEQAGLVKKSSSRNQMPLQWSTPKDGDSSATRDNTRRTRSGVPRPLDAINRGLASAPKFHVSTSSKPLCPLTPPDLLGRLEIHFNDTPPTLGEVALNNPNLSMGGWYEPPDCIARSRVAFIIPHRARELHLRALLWHLHPIFQRQQLAYKIYVVHQAGDLAFNKAKLMNIGFLEALGEDNYDCVVFHDVDLLPEDDRLLYRCDETPKHFSVAIDKYNYRLPYTSLFGGVTMVSPEQFRDVNGYSNMYWGWGGEDDDMFNRVFSRGYTIRRPPHHLARYKMSFHNRDSGNRLNLMRFEILERSVNRMQEDGLNSVKYKINSRHELPVYTNITADVGTAVVQCKNYLNSWTCRFVLWLCEHFLVSCGLLQYNSTDDGTLDLLQHDVTNRL